ncbi:MAG: hypothetical protein WAV18_24305 [Roseiarcus sp.]
MPAGFSLTASRDAYYVLIDEGRTVRANLTFDAGLLGAIHEAAR